MKFRFTPAVATVLAGIAVLPVVMAVPAHAVASCPDNHICVWTGTNFTGDRFKYDAFTADDHNLHVPGDSHNARSWRNNTGAGGAPGVTWCLADKAEQTATVSLESLGAGQENNNVSLHNSDLADAIFKQGVRAGLDAAACPIIS